MKITKYLSLIIVSIFFSMPVLSEPATSKSIKQLMVKTGAGNMSVQMMNQMIPALRRMIPDAPDKFWKDVMAEVNPDSMENMVIPIYQKHFSEKDIKAINAFYDTPAGKKFIRVQPAIMQESMAVGQQWGKQLARKILDKYQREFKNKTSQPKI